MTSRFKASSLWFLFYLGNHLVISIIRVIDHGGKTVRHGESIELTCPINQSRSDYFVWLRNSTELFESTEDSEEIKDHSGHFEFFKNNQSMIILNFSSLLIGEYRCKVRNGGGIDKHVYMVDIKDSVDILVTPNKDEIEVGDSVELECKVHCSLPQVDIIWYLPNGRKRNDRQISFTSMSYSDSGEYNCSAYNGGKFLTSNSLNITVHPVLEAEHELVYAEAAYTFTNICCIYYKRKTVRFDRVITHDVQEETSNASPYKQCLQIERVKVENLGPYKCKIVGSETFREIQLTGKPQKPQLIPRVSNTTSKWNITNSIFAIRTYSISIKPTQNDSASFKEVHNGNINDADKKQRFIIIEYTFTVKHIKTPAEYYVKLQIWNDFGSNETTDTMILEGAIHRIRSSSLLFIGLTLSSFLVVMTAFLIWFGDKIIKLRRRGIYRLKEDIKQPE